VQAYNNFFKSGYRSSNSEVLNNKLFLTLDYVIEGDWERALDQLSKVS